MLIPVLFHDTSGLGSAHGDEHAGLGPSWPCHTGRALDRLNVIHGVARVRQVLLCHISRYAPAIGPLLDLLRFEPDSCHRYPLRENTTGRALR